VANGVEPWTGVRNHTAKLNLKAMKKGDRSFFYHSNEGKEIVGIARVAREAYQDPTSDEDWSVIDVEPVAALKAPVKLTAIRESAKLRSMVLLKKSRLSVAPVTAAEFAAVLSAGKTTLGSPRPGAKLAK